VLSVEIKKYEAMAKIALTEDERAEISARVGEFFAIDELAKIDTTKVAPMFTVLNVTNVMREDIQNKTVTRDELLGNAPEQYDGYFQAPKTLA
jgi:aspartyl-tRNA(Asn)/glutamyl-tRNA(Gln) amidotransferase subunit C